MDVKHEITIAHTLNMYYFETMLMVIIALWLIKWLLSVSPYLA